MKGRLILTGCGILKKEIKYLIKKNNWDIDTHFLDSSLHVDFNKLHDKLEGSLNRYSDEDTIVFYGTCHPLMDKIISRADTIRTEGQNCVEILLGEELFTKELSSGAFFLLEDWAKRWDYVTGKAFGDNEEVRADILQLEHKYFLALRTPCSSDFSKEAEHVRKSVSLPLRWMDVSLDNLERVLEEALKQKKLSVGAMKKSNDGPEEIVRLKSKLKHLSHTVAELRVVNEMISSLTPITGLENTVDKILKLLMDTLGGTNIIIYFKTDDQWNFRDIFGEHEDSVTVEDPQVNKVIKNKRFIETTEADTFITGIQSDRYSKGAAWLYPLIIGEDLFGIIKMEGIMLDNPDLKYQIQPFINYASLVMKNVIENYSKLKIAYDKLKLNETRLEALNKLNTMVDVPDEEIAAFALEQAINLTDSKIGFIGRLNKTEDVFTIYAWSESVMDACKVEDRNIDFPIENAGIWAETIRQRKTIIVNDFKAQNPMKKGCPERHIPLTRTLSIPVIEGGKVVAAATVGNKEQDYDDFDVLQLSLFINSFWKHFQRKQSDKSLKSSLKEKEVLLREVHHRVKNNMAVISSLLALQARYTGDSKYLDLLKESQSRIRSMVLVHEKLYQSKDFVHIDLKDYIETLAQDIKTTFADDADISCKVEVDDVQLDIDVLVPCGLVIHEILTNSCKHAFGGPNAPELHITLKAAGKENVVLTIADNGKGYPDGFDMLKSGGLGLQLVKILVGQIDGKLDVKSSGGVTFTITFPAQT